MEKPNMLLIQKLFRFAAVVIVLGYVFYGAEQITYAFMENSAADVQVVIDKDGNITYYGNLFGNDLWYPGREESGTIRITNQFKEVDINSFGLNVDINGLKEGYDKNTVYNSFLKHMKLTIKKGKLLVFNDTLVDNQCISELLWEEGDEDNNGFILNELDRLILTKNNSVDLKYSLYMDERAGEELESMTAAVAFLINVRDSIE